MNRLALHEGVFGASPSRRLLSKTFPVGMGTRVYAVAVLALAHPAFCLSRAGDVWEQIGIAHSRWGYSHFRATCSHQIWDAASTRYAALTMGSIGGGGGPLGVDRVTG